MQTKTYSWVPKAIILFFIIIASADAYFIFLAEQNNRQTLATPKQRSSTIYFKPKRQNQPSQLIFEFKDQNGLPMAADEVKAHLRHPINDERKTLVMQPVSGIRGRYAVDLASLPAEERHVLIETVNPNTKHSYMVQYPKNK